MKDLALQLMNKLAQVPDGLMLPEKTLFSEVNLMLAEPESSGRMSEAMNWLKDKGWVDYKMDDFTGRKWRITEAGIIRKRELGQ